VLLLGATGALGAAGWLSQHLVLASLHPRFIPMAPSTALAFVVSAIAFALLGRGRAADRACAGIGAVVGAAGAARLLTIVIHGGIPDVERLLVRNPGSFGAVPLGRMSPVTAVALAATGAAVVLLAMRRGRRLTDAAGWLGALVTAIGGTVLLGYEFGTPLLYGGRIIPVALPTGAGMLLAGIATLSAAGAAAAPRRAFTGGRARARLLRAFLPATVGAVLFATAAGRAVQAASGVNPALAAALSALAAATVLAVIVWHQAARLGDAFEQAEDTLTRARTDLEWAVAARTAELARINEELDAFTSSVSHDLRAPLRHLTGFAVLLEKKAEDADPQVRRYAGLIGSAAARMTALIDDLLIFARTSRAPLRAAAIDLNELVRDIIATDIHEESRGRVIEWQVDPLPIVSGDRALLRQAFLNLLSNAVKYTRTRDCARVHVGAGGGGYEAIVFVRDNGVGFDMAYAGKLFGVFQRLHGDDEFEGTGVGLANVRRIVQRHGGRTWAQGAPQQGATFFLSFPSHERHAE
jgi:signal transduction histidine kinase